ncbi:MAG: hypothetical protein K2X47_06105 [Bdellovibrionales bacterium]|nr:hypothetical protein [Bdellovibrionales bacterium]
MVGQRVIYLRHWVWLCTIIVGALGVFLWTPASFVFASSESDKARSRLEELFRWKVSDTLLLDTKEETKFNDTLKEISERRRTSQEKMDLTTQKISKATSPQEIESLVKDYEVALKDYTSSQHDEFTKLKKLFGAEKFGKYLALKYDISSKLKSAISTRALATKDEKVGTDGK